MDIYKRKYLEILKLVDQGGKDLSQGIKEINATNYLSSTEFANFFGNDTTDTILNENSINYLIIPYKNFFSFQALLLLSDGLFAAPCNPVEEDKEWEIYVSDIKKIAIKDMEDIQQFLENVCESFKQQLDKSKLFLAVDELGGTIISKQNSDI